MSYLGYLSNLKPFSFEWDTESDWPVQWHSKYPKALIAEWKARLLIVLYGDSATYSLTTLPSVASEASSRSK